MHELGHLLALDHDSLPFMAESLGTGIRLPVETGSEASTRTEIVMPGALALARPHDSVAEAPAPSHTDGHGPMSRLVRHVWSAAAVVNPDDGLAPGSSTSGFGRRAAAHENRGVQQAVTDEHGAVVLESQDDDRMWRAPSWLPTAALAVPGGAPTTYDATLGRVQCLAGAYMPLLDFTHRVSHTQQLLVRPR
jgi:hypothetical protein